MVVKYSAQNDKLLINPTIFTNSAVNTDSINIANHGFKTGQKLFYDGSPATGLTSQRSYFVYKTDDSNFKLAETRYDVINEPPRLVSITANSGGTISLKTDLYLQDQQLILVLLVLELLVLAQLQRLP